VALQNEIIEEAEELEQVSPSPPKATSKI